MHLLQHWPVLSNANAEQILYQGISVRYQGKIIDWNGGRGFGSIITVCFCVFLVVVTVLGKLPHHIISVYLVMSLMAFCIYAFDKSAARNNRRRIKENTLHLFSIVGGWPGAFYAQNKLRHKSSKPKFKNMFWVTVTINLSVFCWLFTKNGSQFLKIAIAM